MKTIKLLTLVLATTVSAHALAQTPPPPLSPVEYLDPEDGRATPAQPTSTPRPVVTPVATPRPVSTPAPVTTPTPTPTPRPVATPTPTPAPSPVTRPSPGFVSNPVVQPIATPAPSVTRPSSTPPPVYRPNQPSTRPAATPPPVYQPANDRISSVRGFRVGEEVATERYHLGIVEVLYRNESADIRFRDGVVQNWPISRLMKTERSMNGFAIGQTVVNDRHAKGVLVTIFSDGMTSVRYRDGVAFTPMARLSREITELRGFTVGQAVVNDRHARGTIVAIYADDTADVRFSDGVYTWPLSRLSRPISSKGDFSVGQVVVNDRRARGTIVEIYADDTAKVRFNDGDYNWPLSRLSKPISSLGGFTIGQVIVNDRHARGTIVDIYADQTADVRYSDGVYNWPLSRLGKPITSLGGFTVGQVVVNDRNSRGTITEIFADQTADVRYSDGVYNWPLSRLGREITSLRGISVGQRVATDTNRSGVVEQIYWTDMALVRFSDGTQTWPLSRLSGAYCSPSICPR